MSVPKLLNPDLRIGTVYVTADESAYFLFIYLFTIFTMFLHSSNQLHFILLHLFILESCIFLSHYYLNQFIMLEMLCVQNLLYHRIPLIFRQEEKCTQLSEIMPNSRLGYQIESQR